MDRPDQGGGASLKKQIKNVKRKKNKTLFSKENMNRTILEREDVTCSNLVYESCLSKKPVAGLSASKQGSCW